MLSACSIWMYTPSLSSGTSQYQPLCLGGTVLGSESEGGACECACGKTGSEEKRHTKKQLRAQHNKQKTHRKQKKRQ